jgi:hypothetical protein
LSALLLAAPLARADMLDPATDKPGEEWCYLANPRP